MSFVMIDDIETLQAENARLSRLVKEQRNQLRGMNRAIDRYDRMFSALVRLDRLYAVEGSLKAVGVQVHNLGVRVDDLATQSTKRKWLSKHWYWSPSRWGRRWTDKS